MRAYIRFAVAIALWVGVCALGVVVARAAEPLPPITTCSPVGFQYDYLTNGRHLAVLCTKPLGTGVYAHGFSCLHSACSPATFGMSILTAFAADKPKDEIGAQWTKHIKWTCDAPPDAAAVTLCTERQNWINANWATWTKDFKPAVWWVKPNGTYTSRPAFALVNGVLGTKEVARATVMALCDVTKPTAPASGGDIRAEFGVPGVVTLCARVQ